MSEVEEATRDLLERAEEEGQLTDRGKQQLRAVTSPRDRDEEDPRLAQDDEGNSRAAHDYRDY